MSVVDDSVWRARNQAIVNQFIGMNTCLSGILPVLQPGRPGIAAISLLAESSPLG
jgi:hypothetical protein